MNQFESIRKNCPALREIFVPEAVWPQFREMASNALNEARQQYILLGALKCGDLRKITLPVHAYLLDGEKPKKLLRKQVIKRISMDMLAQNMKSIAEKLKKVKCGLLRGVK